VWRDNFRDIPVDPPTPGEPFALEILPILFPGKSNRCLHPALGALLRRERPDAVFVQSEPEDFLLSQILLVRAIHHLDFKVIFITWRNMPYSRFGLPYKCGWVYGCAERFGLRHADHCFSFNSAGPGALRGRGFEAVDVIPLAIDTDFFQPTDAAHIRSSLGLRDFTIGFFGRFVDEKGVGLLLEAVAELAHPVQVLLVGNGPARKTWMERARQLAIADRVVHKASVLRSDMPAHLCACDVVVLPSYATGTWKEQFGRVLVEAMACGVPVIGSDCGEIPTVIGPVGMVFPEKDVPALGACLRRVIEEPGVRRRLAALGRARAESHYSCKAIAAAWLRVIRRLLSVQEQGDGQVAGDGAPCAASGGGLVS
jgi:glycosyltransferase involved in cell wall biosynthesis